MRKLSYVYVLTIFYTLISACEDAPGPAAIEPGSSRLSELLRADPAAGFKLADTPRRFEFPADHGPHPGFRNEWWYLTGNLDAAAGRRFGYELTLFRFALAPESTEGARSRWRSNEVIVGHFAVTDADRGRFHVAERFSRAALGLAGARDEPVEIWLEDWAIRRIERPGSDGGTTASWELQAQADGVALSLSLEPLKEPVLNGENGLSRKSSEPGNASYYYSIPRLRTAGMLSIDGDRYDVRGLSWLDREWGSSGLSRNQAGWDWFALQLDDGSDLMFYRLRNHEGEPDPWSAGTWIPANGDPVHLALEDVVIEARDYWSSPRGGRYPVAWTLSLEDPPMLVRIDPLLDAQELDSNVRYWEGAVTVQGERDGRPVSGRGYVELTGYASEPEAE